MPLSQTGPKMVVKTIRLTCSLRRDDELLSPHYTLRRIKQPLARPRSCLQNLVRVVKYIPGAFMSYIVSSLEPISPSSTHTLSVAGGDLFGLSLGRCCSMQTRNSCSRKCCSVDGDKVLSFRFPFSELEQEGNGGLRSTMFGLV